MTTHAAWVEPFARMTHHHDPQNRWRVRCTCGLCAPHRGYNEAEQAKIDHLAGVTQPGHP